MPSTKRAGPRPKRDLITVDLGALELLHLDTVVDHLNKERRDPCHFRLKRYTRSEVLRLAVGALHLALLEGRLMHDGEVLRAPRREA